MNNETKELYEMIMAGMQAMEMRIREERRSDMQSMENRLKDYTDEQVRGVKLLIENDIGKRLDSLFDGYQTVHEAQWGTGERLDQHEDRLEHLEIRQKIREG